MSEESSRPFEMARTMSGDINAAVMGVCFAYRDMERIEAMYADHDRLHHEAQARGEEWDCHELTVPFWDSIGNDIVAIDNPVLGGAYKSVITRLMMERKIREGEVGFVVVEPPREGETEEEYIARIQQAVKDSDDIAAMDPERQHQHDQHSKDLLDKFEKFMADAGVENIDATFEMPTGDEDEDDSPETKIDGEDNPHE